jgi:hypothetical protein
LPAGPSFLRVEHEEREALSEKVMAGYRVRGAARSQGAWCGQMR